MVVFVLTEPFGGKRKHSRRAGGRTRTTSHLDRSAIVFPDLKCQISNFNLQILAFRSYASIFATDSPVGWPRAGTFVSVISTGAPRKFCPIKKSLARSGEIPRKYYVPCRLREFSRKSSPQREPRATGAGQCMGRTPCIRIVRDAARDLSTPRNTFLVRTRSPRRSGRDDSPSKDFEKDRKPARLPIE